MEVLLLIAFIIIIVLLSRLRSLQKEIAESNQKSFQLLRKELQELKAGSIVTTPSAPSVKATDETVVQWRPASDRPKPDPDASTAKPAEQEKDKIEKTEPAPISKPAPVKPTPVSKPVAAYEPAESWWQKWLSNNPDLEKFVGENLINKIGIAVLVLGIAFFVKYAIDQDWIKETGRVCIGIGCGIILVGIAHYMRNSYRSFSSVMAGGGIAVFYFTIAFAFHEYAMFGQTTAFIIMIVITIFAVLLSLLYNKIELAVIALVGGFLAPFLVSNGSGNYVALFSYLLVLNIGMLIIAWFKKWPLLHILSFFFTWIIFASWLLTFAFNGTTALPYKNALLFATLFYIIFLAAVMIHNLRTSKPFKPFDFSMLLAITFSYFAAGMYILSEWNVGAYQGLFTILLGLLNLSLAWYLFKTQKGDKNLLYLLIGLTLTFISLAAPVQLHGHSITLFWSAEAVLLYWLHQRSGIRIFKYSSALIVLLMLISLLMDWCIANDKSNSFLMVIFTSWQGGITNIVAIISLGLYARLLLQPSEQIHYVGGLSNKSAAHAFAGIAAVIFFISCLFSVNLVFMQQQNLDVPNAYHQLITYAFVAAALIAISRRLMANSLLIAMLFVVAAFSFYIFSSIYANNLVIGVINHQYATIHAAVHWLAAAGFLFAIDRFTRLLRAARASNGFTWFISILLLIFCSLECRLLYVFALAGPTTISLYSIQYNKAGLTIVWALFSFALMWLGMRYKYKPLRIISLSIFTLALLKLFILDLKNVSEGGKIAAFIMLGILLLVISFMYQRLKKSLLTMKRKLFNLPIAFMAFVCSAHAQTTGWHYQAKLAPVAASGFYNIVVTPAINAHLKTDISDLRIVNDSGKWVPHVVRWPDTETAVESVLWNLPFKKNDQANGNTEYVVESNGKPISNLQLKLKNAAAERFAEVTGSDDGKTWYSVADSILIQPHPVANENIAIFVLEFPPVSYAFFKIAIHNKGKAPFNITSITYAGIAEGPGIPARQRITENPLASVLQKDSASNTYIRVVQQAAFHFDAIQLAISGIKFFNRQMDVYVPVKGTGSFNHPGQLVATLSISNNSSLRFRLPVTNKADTFFLVVHNDDNLPLSIHSIKTYSSYCLASVYLEKGNQYGLLMDNAGAQEARYDLGKMQIKLSDSIPTLVTGNIESIAQPGDSTSTNNKWMIWLIIALAGVLLAFFAYKLLTEMNKPTTQA